nr:MAG TPA: hypothetical protein [Caudoviricetes sp.]
MKCTGINCPMQQLYDVSKCLYKDCPYRTEPKTNADRIRAMSDEELASFMMYPVCKYTGCKGDCTEKNIGVTGCRKKILNWLQQPAKEE